MKAALLVIPAYNEEQRIAAPLRHYLEYARSLRGFRVRVLVVLNGCRDETLAVVKSVAVDYPELGWVEYADPIGKGGALIAGFRHGDGFDWVGFADADGATTPESLFGLITEDGEGDVRIGARLPSARSFFRRIPSICFNLWVRVLLPVGVSDTQCGAKFFRGWVAQKISPKLSTCDMAVDVDMLVWAHRCGAKVESRHVDWREQPGSSVRIVRTSSLMFLSVLRIFLLSRVQVAPMRWVLALSEKCYSWINRRPRIMPPADADSGR